MASEVYITGPPQSSAVVENIISGPRPTCDPRALPFADSIRSVLTDDHVQRLLPMESYAIPFLLQNKSLV